MPRNRRPAAGSIAGAEVDAEIEADTDDDAAAEADAGAAAIVDVAPVGSNDGTGSVGDETRTGG